MQLRYYLNFSNVCFGSQKYWTYLQPLSSTFIVTYYIICKLLKCFIFTNFIKLNILTMTSYFYQFYPQSFSSRAALHGHTRIHCSGAGGNSAVSQQTASNNVSHTANVCTTTLTGTSLLQQQLTAHDQTADEYPCRICGKYV